MIWVKAFSPSAHAKRGETLFVDLAPNKPEEKAPLGNPARPPEPPKPEPVRKAPPPAPPPPKPQIARAPTPLPPAPKPIPAAPAPQKAAAPREIPPTVPPPPQAAPAPVPQPEPAQAPPAQPAETAKAQSPAQGPPAGAPSEQSAPQTALAKPRSDAPVAGIFRNPGGGLHGGQGGVAGEPVPLDTPDPNYREYMQKVKQRIYAKWGYPYEAQSRGLQGQLIVEFHIAKDGHLQFIELRKSSGEEILDTFAMTAVKLAQIYDPLPPAMNREVLPIVAVFVYSLRGPLSVLQSLQ